MKLSCLRILVQQEFIYEQLFKRNIVGLIIKF
jgi:hypothetical protein